MGRYRRWWRLPAWWVRLALLGGAVAATGCGPEPEVPPDGLGLQPGQGDPAHACPPEMPPEELGLPPNPMQAIVDDEDSYPVPPPPLSDEYFPCTDCHDDTMEVNPNRRELTEEHDNIKLEHDEEHRWCLDCHNPDNRDLLRLASGKTIPFEKSYLLCGQCHGPKLRDWKAGVHGKRTGMWNGKKKYLLCPHCHNPHSPRFKPLEPKPAPVHPEQVQ